MVSSSHPETTVPVKSLTAAGITAPPLQAGASTPGAANSFYPSSAGLPAGPETAPAGEPSFAGSLSVF